MRTNQPTTAAVLLGVAAVTVIAYAVAASSPSIVAFVVAYLYMKGLTK